MAKTGRPVVGSITRTASGDKQLLEYKKKPAKKPLESKIKADIMKHLKTIGPDWWGFKMWGGKFSTSGIPDIVGVYRGIPLCIEIKRPGKKPTALQIKTIDEIRRAGGAAGLANSVEQVRVIIDYFNNNLCEDLPLERVIKNFNTNVSLKIKFLKG